jgi:hypothetical protein
MPTGKTPWFVGERSEALAGLLLTSRKDVIVLSEEKQDDGVDFLAAVSEGEALPTRLFIVQVKGTISSDQAVWVGGVKHVFQPDNSRIFIPVCVFVVNVRENRALYAWSAEPTIEDEKAKLKFPLTPTFHHLDQKAVDEIVNRVKEWYDIVPRELRPEAE